jgi:hypothetical protein
MSWLAVQLWPWLLLTMALGATLTVLGSTKRVKVQRWVPEAEATHEPASVDALISAATTAPGTASTSPVPAAASGPTSPFPEYRGGSADPRPWEAEERWSKPVQRTATRAVRPDDDDDWADPADNWRNWAISSAGPGAGTVPGPALGDAALGNAALGNAALGDAALGSARLSDAELFAAERSATPFDPDEVDDEDDEPFPSVTAVEATTRQDDFAHDEPIDLGPVRPTPVDQRGSRGYDRRPGGLPEGHAESA